MYVGSRLKRAWKSGRRHLKSLPSSRTGENPPYGMIGGSRKRRHHSKPGPRLDPTRPGYQTIPMLTAAVEPADAQDEDAAWRARRPAQALVWSPDGADGALGVA